MEEPKETDLICPICGKKLYKQLHKEEIRGQIRWKLFFCPNFCELNCANCKHANTHGECNIRYCFNMSSYIPINLEFKTIDMLKKYINGEINNLRKYLDTLPSKSSGTLYKEGMLMGYRNILDVI